MIDVIFVRSEFLTQTHFYKHFGKKELIIKRFFSVFYDIIKHHENGKI